MIVSKMRGSTVEQLLEEKQALLKEQFNLRMKKAVQALEKPHLIRINRRNIARINTLIHEKQSESKHDE